MFMENKSTSLSAKFWGNGSTEILTSKSSVKLLQIYTDISQPSTQQPWTFLRANIHKTNLPLQCDDLAREFDEDYLTHKLWKKGPSKNY